MGLVSSGGGWTLAVCVVCAAGIAFVLWQRKAARLFLFWRLGIIALILFIGAQFSLVRREQTERPLVAVVVDTSKSMRLTGRLKNAVLLLRETGGALEKRCRVRWYGFAASTGETADAARLEKLSCGQLTDIPQALWEVKNENKEDLAAMVLVTDGNQTGASFRERWAEELGVPVNVVSPGTVSRVRDAAVSSVQVGDFAFKNTPLEITAAVTAIGLAGKQLNVRLTTDDKEGRLLAAATVTPATDNETVKVPLRFTPETKGRFRYIAAIAPVQGEITTANNRKSIELEVMRDKIRVLFICGQPGPEYAFLRHTLKNDPSIDLVSFVILRNPESIALVPENDLSLIPFPVHTIFTRDIYDFDALILENFSYRGFGFMPDYFVNIRKWVVEKGGSLVMIGGENSFAAGGWAGTPVAEILPVECGQQQEQEEYALFTPRNEELQNAVTELDEDEKKNAALWAALPQLEGCRTLRPKPGASVLLRHPWNGEAVLAAWEIGKGRTAAVAPNTTWRWALGSTTPEAYTRFWNNVVRYLTARGDQKKLQILFDRPGYYAGQDFTMRVRSTDRVAGSALEIACTDPRGNRTLLPAKGHRRHEWVATGTFREPGKHAFTVSDRRNGSVCSRQTAVQEVEASLQQEESQLGVNESVLRDIADKSGGEYLQAASFNAEAVLKKVRKPKNREAADKKALWDSPVLLGLALLGLAGEWYMRRRKGYL
jgi:uncharacterized membrane protein/Mg-chelatase subunit ChlD